MYFFKPSIFAEISANSSNLLPIPCLLKSYLTYNLDKNIFPSSLSFVPMQPITLSNSSKAIQKG